MLSLGPLSGMPLSSVPDWERLRIVLIRCFPKAEYQPLRIVAKYQPTTVTVNYVIGTSTPAAYLVSSDSGRISVFIRRGGQTALAAPRKVQAVASKANRPTAQLRQPPTAVLQQASITSQATSQRSVAAIVRRIRQRVIRHTC